MPRNIRPSFEPAMTGAALFSEVRKHTNSMKAFYIRCLVALTATVPFTSIGFADPADGKTTYPISHVVVIFQENVSFGYAQFAGRFLP
jgi:phospholipase C